MTLASLRFIQFLHLPTFQETTPNSLKYVIVDYLLMLGLFQCSHKDARIDTGKAIELQKLLNPGSNIHELIIAIYGKWYPTIIACHLDLRVILGKCLLYTPPTENIDILVQKARGRSHASLVVDHDCQL